LFSHFCSKWKEYLSESHVAVQKQQVMALIVFLDYIHPDILKEHQNDILRVLIEKTMAQTKQEVDVKALECIILIFEVSGEFEMSVETLQEMIQHKNVKVVANATTALASIVDHFGVSQMDINLFIPHVLKVA